MQSKPLNEASDSSAPLNFIDLIHKINTAWLENIHPIVTKAKKLEAFDDISSMTIERHHNLYITTNGLAKHRFAVLGL